MDVSSPKREDSAASECYRWQCPSLSIDVVCAKTVLEAIRSEAVDGVKHLCPLEAGGVLFGRKTEQCVEILLAEPLECEERTCPSFISSKNDELLLEAALTIPKPRDLEPIGLYMTRIRRGFSLDQNERRILNRYFPQPWQMALLLAPAALGPTSAGFFIRSASYETGYISAHYFVLQAPGQHDDTTEPVHLETPNANLYQEEFAERSEKSAQPSAAGVGSDARPGPPPAPPVTKRNVAEPNDRYPLTHLDALVTSQEKQDHRTLWKLLATLALLILSAVIAATLRTSLFSHPQVAVQISDLGPDIRVGWDPAAQAFQGATGGILEIIDDNNRPAYLPITRDGLDSGGIVYTPRSEKTDVQLKITRGSEIVAESKVYVIINSARPAAPLLKAMAPSGKSEATFVLPATVSGARPDEVIPPSSGTHKKITNVEDPPAHFRMVVRTFNPPLKGSSAGTEVGTQSRLPDLPEIHAFQPSALLPLANASPIGVRPPPAPPQPEPAAIVPPRSRSGRLIWTGDLRKNGLLAISSTGASLGVLNGRLPGVPVKISVQPAQLVDGGITIFAGDRTKSGTTEVPSAHNGWNVVAYRWDPRRTSEVTVMEAPGSSNGWQRLVLGTGNHNISMLVVDWERDGNQ